MKYTLSINKKITSFTYKNVFSIKMTVIAVVVIYKGRLSIRGIQTLGGVRFMGTFYENLTFIHTMFLKIRRKPRKNLNG